MTEEEKVAEMTSNRYRVIADYPNSLYPVGYIIHEAENLEGATFFKTTVHKYPHIFKPLKWYEVRGKKELPQYVKNNPNGILPSMAVEKTVYKVVEWITDTGDVWMRLKNDEHIHASHILPATEKEYLQYQQSTDHQ